MTRQKGTLQNLKHFQKGQTGNPNGRPKKHISLINSKLMEEGYTPATNTDIQGAFLTLLNLPMDKIKEIEKDLDAPALYRIAAKELLGTRAAEYVERALDRSLGKAQQKIDLKANFPTNVKELSDEELEKIAAGGLSNLSHLGSDKGISAG